MQEVAINKCYGGFGLSQAAYMRLIEWGCPVVAPDFVDDEESMEVTIVLANNGEYWRRWSDKFRSHPLLLRVIKEFGNGANSRFSEVAIVEVPDGVDWGIGEYDGTEWVEEKHQTWS